MEAEVKINEFVKIEVRSIHKLNAGNKCTVRLVDYDKSHGISLNKTELGRVIGVLRLFEESM